MFEYDTSLKLLLKPTASRIVQELTGGRITRWISVELPTQNTRVDLLGETEDGELIHIELQSTNDPKMALRMAEYCVRIVRLYSRFARQVVLYVGEEPLRMASEFHGPEALIQYRIIDIRDLDGERLLASDQVADNIVAILARLQDSRGTVRQVLKRIAALGARLNGRPRYDT